MHVANKIRNITPAVTLSVSARAKEMAAQGLDVCNLSAGAPQIDTAAHIKEAAKKALDQGKTKYGPVGGEPELREVVANKLRKENGLQYTAKNIAISNGCKHSLMNLMMVLLEPGDEVIIPAPYWLSFPDMVRLADGVPVFIETTPESGYKISATQLMNAITPKTRAIIFNSPSNPSGAVYNRAELEAIAKVVVEKNITVVSDEIFEKITYDGAEHVSIASLNPEIFARTIVTSGFSKIYSMTGWRVGYMAGPEAVVEGLIAAQSHMTSNVNSFAQYGGIAAYTDERSQEWIEEIMRAYKARRQLMLDMLNDIPGIKCRKPDATFYLFPSIRETGMKSTDFCNALLESKHVAAVPGLVFGADDHIRFLFATEPAIIEKAMKRLAEFVKSL